MIDILIITAWCGSVILGVTWLFLPWIIIAKLDKVIEELKNVNENIKKR